MSPSALILAGGSGTRFWPSSRRHRPKQLLSLEGERSLLQATVDRLRPLVTPERVWISTTEALRDAVAEQLPEVPPSHVLTEPAARNTAPAICRSFANGRTITVRPFALRVRPLSPVTFMLLIARIDAHALDFSSSRLLS